MAGKEDAVIVPARETGSMSYQCPVLTNTNYQVWSIRVRTIMDANRLWEAVEPTIGAVVDQRKSKMAFAFLFQAIPEDLVLQLAGYGDAKQVWDALKTRFLGVDRVRTARLQTLRREFENLKMKEDESIDDFTGKMSGLVSKAKGLGTTFEEGQMVRKLLDSMPRSFIQIVASIEQCFELDSMRFDEAVGRLKAYEERIKDLDQGGESHGKLLLSKVKRKDLFCEHCGRGGQGSSSHRGSDRGEGHKAGQKRAGQFQQNRGQRERDKSRIRCFKCNELGHYVAECPSWEEKKERVNLNRVDEDSIPLL
ncbi:hypothetical protein E3N88_45774 [Mikania micrantha]|uniref:CCHC-type domain-containing protein n=1 Tax=Mikania micrantha TaxID=192012 RepID=A0A5N6L8B1_9ASTR|nr:hypothetical protein E3N88_45774 [Mikania micrantha]